MRTVPVGLVYNWTDHGMHDGYMTEGECGFSSMATTIARMTHWDKDAARLACDYSYIISANIRGLDWTQYYMFAHKYHQDEVKPTGYSMDSINAVIHACSCNSFEESVVRAVNYGGDADTIGAIAGGMAGAYYGYRKIPARWIKALPDDIKARIDRFVDWAVERIMEEGR
jgi:ADP-ribosyl-[dinitrogen reductase] hydrolase